MELNIYDINDRDTIIHYLGLEYENDFDLIKNDLLNVLDLAKEHECDYIFNEDYDISIKPFVKHELIFQDDYFTLFKGEK